MNTKSGTIIALAMWGWASLVTPLRAEQEPQEAARRQTPPRAQVDTVTSADSSGVQQIEYVLEPIVVVAARERSAAPPVANITVDPRELRETVSDNAYDLIRRVTGLEVHDQGQGPGFASNVVLRGFTADHSSDLLLVVDGVPMNLPVHGHVEGYADWSYLFPGAISSLRVIHGPSSPLYGDFAIAGTAEVYTAADGDGISGQLSGNAFGDASGWVTLGTRGEGGGALAGVELRRSEGWRENSGQELGNVLLRGWRRAGEGRLEGGLALYGGRWDSPGFLSLGDFGAGRLESAANATDGGNQRRGVLHGRYAVPLGSERFLQVMGWGVLSDWELALTVPGHTDAVGNLYQTREADRRSSFGGQAEFSWLPRVGELTVGASARRDWSAYDLGRSLRRVPIEPMVALNAEHASASGYLRWRWHASDRLGLDLGARMDHVRYRSYNRLGLEPASPSVLSSAQLSVVGGGISTQEIRPSFHIVGEGGPLGHWIDGSRTLLSPKLGAELRLTDRWEIMASSSRGFRSAVGVVGDPDRKPVIVWANEVGLDYDAPSLGGHLSLFRMNVSNERIQDPITLEIASSGSSVRQGIEATAEVAMGSGVTLYGRGTLTDALLSGRYADAHDDHNQTGTGTGVDESPEQDVPGIADYLAQVAVEAPLWQELTGRVEWRVTGPYVPIGEPDVRTDAFSTLDARLSYPVRDGMRLDLEMRNVLDSKYAEMRSSGYVSPGTPRSISLTLQVMASGR